jgi:flagellar M-ring protein FliF
VAELRRRVTRLLEARVGTGRAIVEVALEAVTESEQITERKVDPQSRVAISSETEENSASSSGSGGSPVTVASNLPTGDTANGDSNAQSTDSQTRERTNFEISETTRELIRGPGAVRRLTVAVLVDGQFAANDAGEDIWQPRSEEELAALKDLVAAAVGYDEARGDVITIRSMAFQPPPAEGAEEGSSILDGVSIDVMGLIQLAVLALVSLVLGLFVLRPILASRRLPPPPRAILPQPAPALSGVVEEGDFVPAGRVMVASPGPAIDAQDASYEPPDHVARLRRLISERQDETAEILRSWMNEPAREDT